MVLFCLVKLIIQLFCPIRNRFKCFWIYFSSILWTLTSLSSLQLHLQLQCLESCCIWRLVLSLIPICGCLRDIDTCLSLWKIHERLLVNSSAFAISGLVTCDCIVVVGDTSRLIARHIDRWIYFRRVRPRFNHFWNYKKSNYQVRDIIFKISIA